MPGESGVWVRVTVAVTIHSNLARSGASPCRVETPKVTIAKAPEKRIICHTWVHTDAHAHTPITRHIKRAERNIAQ